MENILKYEKIEDFEINRFDSVRVRKTGNIVKIQYLSKKNNECKIKKINDFEYIDLKTGEIKQFEKTENRLQSKKFLKKSFENLRDIINCNVSSDNTKNCKWVTLTYKENMQDTKRLYKDFEKFIKRLKYHLGKDKKFEYIVAMEPQGRGAWHCHLLLIFDKKAPFISNATMEQIWGNGFTKTKKLSDIDNVGAYLTAYLTDLPIEKETIKDINFYDNEGVKVQYKSNGLKEKSFKKGARLKFYPSKFNIYRCSKGIKKPIEENGDYLEEKEKLGLTEFKPNFKNTFKVVCEELNLDLIISQEEYNLQRLKSQQKYKKICDIICDTKCDIECDIDITPNLDFNSDTM